MGKEDQATPMSNQFLEYRFDRIDSTLQTIMDHIETNGRDFNNHVREDTVLTEQVRTLLEEKKSNAGIDCPPCCSFWLVWKIMVANVA